LLMGAHRSGDRRHLSRRSIYPTANGVSTSVADRSGRHRGTV